MTHQTVTKELLCKLRGKTLTCQQKKINFQRKNKRKNYNDYWTSEKVSALLVIKKCNENRRHHESSEDDIQNATFMELGAHCAQSPISNNMWI